LTIKKGRGGLKEERPKTRKDRGSAERGEGKQAGKKCEKKGKKRVRERNYTRERNDCSH